MTCNR